VRMNEDKQAALIRNTIENSGLDDPAAVQCISWVRGLSCLSRHSHPGRASFSTIGWRGVVTRLCLVETLLLRVLQRRARERHWRRPARGAGPAAVGRDASLTRRCG
jgi:hypothetical protein